jgi:3-oxoacyl-[acyl-carrier protein] reductase
MKKSYRFFFLIENIIQSISLNVLNIKLLFFILGECKFMKNEKQMKKVLITGASRGIGRSIAVALAERGYSLMLTGRDIGKLEETKALCLKAGADKLVLKTADITSESDITALFDLLKSEFETLDVLVNNAGMGIFKHITDTSLEEWRLVQKTNLDSAFIFTREAMKMMKQQRYGTIINIASVVGIKGYPNQGAYTASKHGMVGLTKVTAEEGREFGIKAHVICPGGVATEMVLQARPDIPADELIPPEEVSRLVGYFLDLPDNVTVDIVHLRRFSSSSF